MTETFKWTVSFGKCKQLYVLSLTVDLTQQEKKCFVQIGLVYV